MTSRLFGRSVRGAAAACAALGVCACSAPAGPLGGGPPQAGSVAAPGLGGALGGPPCTGPRCAPTPVDPPPGPNPPRGPNPLPGPLPPGPNPAPGPVAPPGPGAPPGPAPTPCAPLALQPRAWPSPNPLPESPLVGELELGQTHVIKASETRLAPRMVAERPAIVLFTPAQPLDSATPLHVAALHHGQPLGAAPMLPPERLPQALEQALTHTLLPPYSHSAWSAELPGTWMREGVELLIGFEAAQRHVMRHVLSDLAPPAHITMRRGSMVLFGDDSLLPAPMNLEKLAHDYYPVVPFSSMRFIDYTPFRVESVLVPQNMGSVVRATSDQEVRAAGSGYYHFLKRFFALRLAAANAGHGLVSTSDQLGSEAYAIGTNFVQGTYRTVNGTQGNTYDHPSGGAGWLGWTCLHPGGGCGNVTTHEWGHSFTLHHFHGGQAMSWGISGEYPQHGINLATHPWGFDTWRGQFRTWYQVQTSAMDLNNLQGKRDPMNGGDPANPETCFPQYTAYHALRIQKWHEERLVVADYDGRPGLFRWDRPSRSYRRAPPEGGGQEPVALRVPAMTVIGAISTELADIYAPIFTREGTLFTLPDPRDPGLPQPFHGARHYLEIETATGPLLALIALGDVAPGEVRYFSLNLPADGSVRRISLRRSTAAYPNAVAQGSNVIATRAVNPAPAELPPVYRAGTSPRSQASVRLTLRCKDDANCGPRSQLALVHKGPGQISFDSVAGQPLSSLACDRDGGYSEFGVPVANQAGVPSMLVMRGQRIIDVDGRHLQLALPDHGNLQIGSYARQGVRLWLPIQPNLGFAAGRYRTQGPVLLAGQLLGASPIPEPIAIRIEVDVDVFDPVTADLSAGATFTSLPFRVPELDSSVYFLTRREYGPSVRVWYRTEEPSEIRAPVVDSVTGAPALLVVRAWRDACGTGMFPMQAGEASRNCEHRLFLQVEPGKNPGLASGTTYVSPVHDPVPIFVHRWHAPNAEARIGAFGVGLRYTAP